MELEWKSVTTGIVVGVAVSWAPKVAKAMSQWWQKRKERKALAQIKRHVYGNAKIAKDDRAKEILKRRLSYAMANGWVSGGPFDPLVLGIAKLDGTAKDIEDAAKNMGDIEGALRDIGDSVGDAF